MSATHMYKKKTSLALKADSISALRPIRVNSTTVKLKRRASVRNVEAFSLAEAINRCNEKLEKHPKFDFRGVKVVK